MNLQFEKDDFLSRVFMDMVNTSENEDLVEKTPSVVKGDMALIPRLLIGENKDLAYSGPSVIVTNEMVLEFQISIEDFQEKVMENSRKMFPGQIIDVLKAGSDIGDDNLLLFDNIAVPEVYAITNSMHDGGMAALFYDPDIIDNLASMKEKDLIVFPLDGNAAYCVEFNGSEYFDELQNDYSELCESMREQGENVLSDKILHYDRSSKTLTDSEGEELTLGIEPEYHAVNRHSR